MITLLQARVSLQSSISHHTHKYRRAVQEGSNLFLGRPLFKTGISLVKYAYLSSAVVMSGWHDYLLWIMSCSSKTPTNLPLKDNSLIEHWYDVHGSALYGFVLSVTGQDLIKSEDLFAKAFYRVSDCRAQFNPDKDRILPWLLRQAIQVLIENGFEMVNFYPELSREQAVDPITGEFPISAFSQALT